MTFETEASPRQKKVRSHFPLFMRESAVVQAFSKAIAEEMSSRHGDSVHAILRAFRASLTDRNMLYLWERMLNVSVSPGESENLRRARIIAKTTRRHRIRRMDIATTVRRFMDGTLAYLISPVESSTIIRVSELSGFFPGLDLFVGPNSAQVVSIDKANREILLDTEVTAQSFSIVSTSGVTIVEDYANYFFNVYVDDDEVNDLPGMIIAVHEAKPAHLGFAIYSFPPVTYNEEGMDYVGNLERVIYDDETGTYDEGGAGGGNYDPPEPGILYNGVAFLYST